MMGSVPLDPILRLADGVPPSVHYVDDKDMPPAAQQATTVADWAWIMLNSDLQKDLERVRAMVFVPSLEEAQALQTKIQGEKPEWMVYYLPADAEDGLVSSINIDFRNVVIIMLPYFGPRLPIRRINQALCSDTVQITLFEQTDERKEIRQVPLEWIDFLIDYACPRQSTCRVFYGFERAPDERERRGLEEFEKQLQGSGAPRKPAHKTILPWKRTKMTKLNMEMYLRKLQEESAKVIFVAPLSIKALGEFERPGLKSLESSSQDQQNP